MVWDGMHSGSLAWWGCGVGSMLEAPGRVDRPNLSKKNKHGECSMFETPRTGNDIIYLSEANASGK